MPFLTSVAAAFHGRSSMSPREASRPFARTGECSIAYPMCKWPVAHLHVGYAIPHSKSIYIIGTPLLWMFTGTVKTEVVIEAGKMITWEWLWYILSVNICGT